MTHNEVREIAIQLDFASGYPLLSPDNSWDAESILGPARYAMFLAANHLWFAASLLQPEET